MNEPKEISYRVPQEFGKTGSAFARYCDVVIGKRGILSFLAYEFLQWFILPLPGALGLLVRRWVLPFYLKSCGKGVVFGRNLTLRHPHKIAVGDGCIIDDYCLLDAKGDENQGITLGAQVFLGRYTILSCKNGDIHLADRVNMGFHSEVFSGSAVVLGEDTLVAAYCYFIGGGHALDDPEKTIAGQSSPSLGITCGPNCWFGAGAKIMDGVRIGDHSVVGTGAVVTRDVPDQVIVAGVPARMIRKR